MGEGRVKGSPLYRQGSRFDKARRALERILADAAVDGIDHEGRTAGAAWRGPPAGSLADSDIQLGPLPRERVASGGRGGRRDGGVTERAVRPPP